MFTGYRDDTGGFRLEHLVAFAPTTGSILAVRWDQWLLGYKRRMSIEVQRFAEADANQIVAEKVREKIRTIVTDPQTADRTYIDTIMVGDLAKAIRLKMVSATLIGAASYPTLTIDIAKAKLREVSKSIGNNDIVRQTVSFKGFYSISDTSMVTAVLRNTKSGVY